MWLSRQEYWSGLPFPSPMDLSHVPGINVKLLFVFFLLICLLLLGDLKQKPIRVEAKLFFLPFTMETKQSEKNTHKFFPITFTYLAPYNTLYFAYAFFCLRKKKTPGVHIYKKSQPLYMCTKLMLSPLPLSVVTLQSLSCLMDFSSTQKVAAIFLELDFYHHYDKSQDKWLKATSVCNLTVLEIRTLELRCLIWLVTSQGLEENPFTYFFQLQKVACFLFWFMTPSLHSSISTLSLWFPLMTLLLLPPSPKYLVIILNASR